jgi:chromosome segregation ATPase
MRTGETSAEQEQALVEEGYAKVNHDGSITMSAAGRSLLSAANSGNIDSAEEARAKATKPDKPKAGAKPKEEKPSPEEIRKGNIKDTREELSDSLSTADFDNLTRFSEGADLAEPEARRLAQTGLVELDAEGTPRMTTAGKRLIRAAEDGEIREAKDQLSHARDDVRETMERAEETRAKAREMMGKASNTRERGQSQAERVREEAETIRMEAEELQPEIDLMKARIAAENHPEVRAQLQDELSNLQDKYLQYQQAANEMTTAAREIAASAEDQAQTYEERAETYRNEAKAIEDSVGGGLRATPLEPQQEPQEEKSHSLPPESSILGKIATLLGIKQKVTPTTAPLPPFTAETAPLSDEEKEAAIAAWKGINGVPSDILEARTAGPLEISNAIEEGMEE